MKRTEKEKVLREVVGSTNDIRIEEELTRPRTHPKKVLWPNLFVRSKKPILKIFHIYKAPRSLAAGILHM
jgi:hypothetical protein